MRIEFRFLGWVAAVSALVALVPTAGCTTDDNDTPGQGGAGGSGTSPTGGAGGSAGGGGSTTPSAGLACAKQTVLDGTKPAITNFDNYDGASNLSKWSTSFGGDSSTGLLAGTFGYGDRADGTAQTFDMTAGHSAPYGLRVADSMALAWGGGMGLWLSGCIDASKFSGISFWTRGVAPTGSAKVSILVKDTTSSTPATATAKTGPCPGITDTTCVHPKYDFEVTDTWKQIQVPWTAFTPGNAAGTEVKPNGSTIWQIQWDIGLQWLPDAANNVAPVPAAYELVVDDVAFF